MMETCNNCMLYIGYRYNLKLRSRGSYILVGIWCLMAVVLVLDNAYAGTLFSFLSVPKLEPIVNSLEELANDKHLQIIIQDRNELANRFLVYHLIPTASAFSNDDLLFQFLLKHTHIERE